MADYDMEALSLTVLQNMQRDVTKAISTYENRQKAEARNKVAAVARVVSRRWWKFEGDVISG